LLSGHWERSEQLRERARRFPVWIVPVICGGALLVFYVLFSWSLVVGMDDVKDVQIKTRIKAG
jgi:type VI protein secretion system component VasF